MASTSAYHSASRSTRDHFIEPPSLLSRIIMALPSGLSVQIQRLWDRNFQSAYTVSTRQSRISRPLRRWYWPRSLLNLPHLLVAVWFLTLLWGERWVFQSSIEACDWRKWERWLIDPHSYPGRPWPLDTFTILHTDNYLKRSYISLQKKLHPDTIFFLGDLFDGGREWKTAKGNTKDADWANGLRPSGEQAFVETWGKRYGEDFWLHEYGRFGNIFLKYWNLGGDKPGPGQPARRIIASLPGNHDLGFGDQIKIPIRNRFEVYFGEGNRVDVIANHTFVSVDSVSLSAGESEHDTTEITKPVEKFLSEVQVTKRKAVARELDRQAGHERTLQYKHKVEEPDAVDYKKLRTLDPGPNGADFPTILLTHVPLYRSPGTPCGPQREHWPPTTPPKGQTSPVNPDERNAISISKGYQYQNVLSEADSVRVISAIGNVGSVFSGDDHDYCEIVHPENKNHAREITVKSMNWAMGIRKPGFVMLSMWNPVGPDGRPLHSSPSGHGSAATTTESHLCLLPDQLGILIRYVYLIVISLLALTIRAILTPMFKLTPFSAHRVPSEDMSLLPTTAKDSKRREAQDRDGDHDPYRSSNSSTSSTASTTLAPRTVTRTRSFVSRPHPSSTKQTAMAIQMEEPNSMTTTSHTAAAKAQHMTKLASERLGNQIQF
ncbi:uncharacterized protein BP5553_08619 [Venustampulla echinocandica]|uniref:Calcineurin-like phosphoesterase domain-containing protein n=1 Tax=Venustampulla echinocandica TaxID=2656787 RepID=A0A370TEV7_9HELO|nr:uncharacterized protein BP5553_08619 [Venustampulla echinocandica]RDL33180.1 hypothetical protein BP5553_08619 [Venustampulla echinocandica]